MAMNIGLGIDVDSTSVERGAVALDKYGRELKDVEQGLRGVEKAGSGASRPIEQIGRASGTARVGLASVRGETTAFGRAMADARGQAIGLSNSFGLLRTAIAGLGVGLVIRDMGGFVTELARVKSTLEQVTGSVAAGGAEFEYLRDVAGRLGVSYLGVAGDYSKLLASATSANVPLEQTRTLFEGVTAASVRFSLSQEATSGALNALQQMISKGKVSSEELSEQLGERLPGAFAIAAKSMNMTTGELRKAMENGLIPLDVFIDKFGREMLDTFGEAAEGMDTVTTRTADFKNAMDDLRIVVAESGFEAAMMNVLGALAEFAQSDYAETLATGLGRAFEGLADVVVGVLTPIKSLRDMDDPFTDMIAGAIEFAVEVMDVIRTVGDFGSALDFARQIALEVWDRIGIAADAMSWIVSGAFGAIKANAIGAFSDILQSAVSAFTEVANIINSVGSALKLPPIKIDGLVEYSAEIDNLASGAREVAKIDTEFGLAAMDVAKAPLKAVDAMASLVAGTKKANEEMARLAGKGGKGEGGAGAVAAGIEGAGKAAKTVTDELAKAREILSDQRDDLARLTLEWESGAEGSEFVRKEFEKLEDALRKSGVSMKDFLEDEGETEASVRRRLEDTEAITDQLKIQGNLSKSIAGGIGDIAGGDVKGGLTGIIEGLSETVGKPFQDAVTSLSDDMAKTVMGAMENSGLDPITVGAVGSGLGMAAVGALEGNVQQIGSGLGSAAGAAIGSAFGPIGTILGSTLGGAAGGFMSKFFGKDAPTTTASGTAFAGTDYAQANAGGRRYSDEEGKTGALDIVQSGLRSLLENFDKALTDVSTNFVADVKSLDIDNKVKDIDAARLAIAQTLSDTIYEDKGASETAAEIERRVDEFMKLSVIIATAGKVAATETQVAFREIADQFSKANVEILRAVGFSMKEIERAKEALVSDLRTSVEQEMLDTLIELGKASKDELQAWRALQFQAVDERKAAAVATARDIGADVDLVRKAFRAERGAVTDEYGEMLRGLAEKTVEVAKEAIERVSRLDRAQGAFEGLSTIASGPNADSRDIRRARRAEMDVLQAGNKERIAEAKRLGLGMKFADQVYNAERDKIVDKYGSMLRSLTEKTIEVAKEAIEKVSRLDRAQGAFEGLSTIASGPNADSGDIRKARRAELDVLKAGNKDRIAEAKRLGLGMKFAEQVYNAERESIIESYTTRLAAVVNGPLEKSIAGFAESIGVQTRRLSNLEGKRAEVLGELEQRSDAMRQAEQSLADTRAQLARSTELTPGGPMQQLAELRRQFDAAIRSARGGDTDAAATASGLAQEVLGAGRDVYASSGAYASLFRGVNADLLSAQGGIDKRADQIDAQLDKETFADVTEKSTMALLKALGTLNGSIAKVEGKIGDQTRAMERAETKRRIA